MLLRILVLLKLLQVLNGCTTFYNRNFRFSSCPTYYFEPTNETEVVQIVQQASSQNAVVRAVGGNASWDGVAMIPSKDYRTGNDLITYWLDMTKMTKITVDNVSMTATIEGGAKVYNVCVTLETYGVGLPDFGGPHVATFVGSAITGTHGKGSHKNPIGTMARQIIGLRMVIANGTIITANETYNSDILYAARISLGALGIITEVTVKVVPIFYVTRNGLTINNVTNVKEALRIIDEVVVPLSLSNDYIYGGIDFFRQDFSFQLYNVTEKNTSNPLCWNADETGYIAFPCTDVYYKSISPPVALEIAHGRNQESEFYVPDRVWVDAFKEMVRWAYSLENSALWNASRDWFHVFHDPSTSYDGLSGETQIDIRWTGNDSDWLSSSYGETMVQIGLYMPGNFTVAAPNEIFDAWVTGYYHHLFTVNESFWPVRIHLGKESLTDYCDIEKFYPKMADFKTLRTQLDPNQMFINDNLRDKLGICPNDTCCNICCCTNYSCGFSANYVANNTGPPNNSGSFGYKYQQIFITIFMIMIGFNFVNM